MFASAEGNFAPGDLSPRPLRLLDDDDASLSSDRRPHRGLGGARAVGAARILVSGVGWRLLGSCYLFQCRVYVDVIETQGLVRDVAIRRSILNR